MDLNLSEEQAMMRDTVRRFVADRYTLDGLRAVEASDRGWSAETWADFAAQGWLALPFTEEAGGLGGTPEDLALLMIEFGRGHVLEPYVSTAVVCGHIFAGAESDLVGDVIEGRCLLALAHGAAARPRDLLAVEGTVATRRGGGLMLTGAKRVVPDAAGADRLVVSARGEGGTLLLLANPGAPGVAVSPYRLIDGSTAADIQFDGAAAEVLASGEAAERLLREAVEWGTLATLAQAVGSTERSLELTRDYVSVRQQFGRPIGKFQALSHILAAMFVEAQEARSALYHALAAWQEGGAQRARALSAAKVMVSQAGRFVTRNGIQLHGGYGMTEEFLIGHHFRRQIVLEKLFGDHDHHLAALAAGLRGGGAQI